MKKQGFIAGTGIAALCAVVCAAVPAFGASDGASHIRPTLTAARGGFGYFTPASADPRLAALFARGGFRNRGMRFTPVAIGTKREVTVAVRASSTKRSVAPSVRTMPQALAEAQTTNIGVQPVSYSLGAAVGWKRFALTGDVARVENDSLTGTRQKADLGVSFNSRKWSSRVQVAAERPVGLTPRSITGGESYSVDVGGSYRLTRNLDVTAGVRYRTDRDRLQSQLDQRRDSQAVYVGTAFKF
jgi:Gram-negative porin